MLGSQHTRPPRPDPDLGQSQAGSTRPRLRPEWPEDALGERSHVATPEGAVGSHCLPPFGDY